MLTETVLLYILELIPWDSLKLYATMTAENKSIKFTEHRHISKTVKSL